MTYYRIKNIQVIRDIREVPHPRWSHLVRESEWTVSYDFRHQKDGELLGANRRHFKTESEAHDYANKVRSGEIDPTF